MAQEVLNNFSRCLWRRWERGPRCVGWGVAWLMLANAPAGKAQAPVSLAEVTVFSSRVANQSSAATFAMPISALRYEPRVDLQTRNLAEGQADLSIRGGTFENCGFEVGAVTITDPQTGHYLAELPMAPAMLGSPRIITGSAMAIGATNTTVGAVAYAWRPIRSAGVATVSVGEDRLRQMDLYQGFSLPASEGKKRQMGIDFAIAGSKSAGAVPNGDHDFERGGIRLQYLAENSQTDLFAGYQGKRFGWPNLYTPFGSNEFENLQTSLLLLNHRTSLADGDFWEAGVFHRRNKDDYAFNRLAAIGAVHPFQHTTWVDGGAAKFHRRCGDLVWTLRTEWLRDRLESTALTFGRYLSRLLSKTSLVGARSWSTSGGGQIAFTVGLAEEDSNRDRGNLSPTIEFARTYDSGRLKKVVLSYTRTSQMPSYTALNSSPSAGLFRGNANLGRAISDNIELGFEGEILGWATEVAAFARRDSALTDWTFRRGVTARSANAVDLNVTGLELVARRSWSAGDLVFGYTALGKTADYRGAAVDASFYALNYARQRFTLALTLRISKELELRIDNAYRQQAPNFLRVVGGNRALTSAAGLFWRPVRLRGWELSLRADNLWNGSFQEIPAVPASPRQVSMAVGRTW